MPLSASGTEKKAVSASKEPRTALSVVFTRRGSHCCDTPLPVLPVRKQILREIYICVLFGQSIIKRVSIIYLKLQFITFADTVGQVLIASIY